MIKTYYSKHLTGNPTTTSADVEAFKADAFRLFNRVVERKNFKGFDNFHRNVGRELEEEKLSNFKFIVFSADMF